MEAFDERLAHREDVSGSRGFAPRPCPGEECEPARSENPSAEPFTSQPPQSSEAVTSLVYRVSRGMPSVAIRSSEIFASTLLA
jgi:hypothetical protein